MTTRLSMERIRELDRKWDAEVRKFLYLGKSYGDLPPFFLWEDFAGRISEMAAKWKVPEKEFRVYAGLHMYLNLVARNEVEGLRLPEAVAKELGIPLVIFMPYFNEQVRLTRDAIAPDQDDDISFWHDAFAEDWYDFEEDLLEDAARRGLCN